MRFRLPILIAALCCASATPAFADVTVFLGANTTPSNRLARGAAVGTGFVIVAFEFEYAATSEDENVLAPSLKTGMVNAILQTPVAIHGFRPYITAGTGVYRERMGERTDTGFAPNIGAGVKMTLIGPLRLRIDYRTFRLGHDALYSPAHRVYAGLNLSF